ncbi:hypothetical protein V6N13_114375 [Hibiscus sabdariffa]
MRLVRPSFRLDHAHAFSSGESSSTIAFKFDEQVFPYESPPASSDREVSSMVTQSPPVPLTPTVAFVPTNEGHTVVAAEPAEQCQPTEQTSQAVTARSNESPGRLSQQEGVAENGCSGYDSDTHSSPQQETNCDQVMTQDGPATLDDVTSNPAPSAQDCGAAS